MGKSQRDKGRRGEGTVALLLEERDYIVTDTTAGKTEPDLIALKDGIMWAVEVKDHIVLHPNQWRKQARENAKRKKMRWMLVYHLPGYRSWVVERQGCDPAFWRMR